jgi:hypothetical protein
MMFMIRSLSQFFYRQSNGVRLIVLFAFMVLFNVLVFPAMQQRMGTFVNPLDLRFGFSAEEALAFLTLLGEQGRDVYLFVEGVVDILYPLVYTVFSMIALSFFYRNSIPQNNPLRLMNVMLPLIMIVADFAENSGIILMLLGFPNAIESHVAWTAVANECKWIAAAVSLGSVAVGFVWWLVKGRHLPRIPSAPIP